MLSCSRTIEIDEANIRNYFSSFPADAQDIIAEGEFVVKTVSGMPSNSVLVGVSSYGAILQKHMTTFVSMGTAENYAKGRGSAEDRIESIMIGHMYSIDEFRSQFNKDINDWSQFDLRYSVFYSSSGRRVNGWIFTSTGEDLVVYLLFLDNI